MSHEPEQLVVHALCTHCAHSIGADAQLWPRYAFAAVWLTIHIVASTVNMCSCVFSLKSVTSELISPQPAAPNAAQIHNLVISKNPKVRRVRASIAPHRRRVEETAPMRDRGYRELQ